jgi:uncharacterized protein (AIM24 family)
MAMDVVDYEIKGSEMQFVEVELDPGEAAVGEAGSMMFMDAGISIDTVFGDGSGGNQGGPSASCCRQRLLTGESLFTTTYTTRPVASSGSRRRTVPRQNPADAVGELGGMLLCQKDAFLCAARACRWVRIPAKLGVGPSAAKDSSCKSSRAMAPFVHACGTVVKRIWPAANR